MKRRTALVPLVALATLAFAVVRPAAAETTHELFAEGNARYWQGDIAGAQSLYHRLVEDFRINNPVVYFNLANSYAREGRYGSAILYYQRALKYGPDAATREAIAANLSLVRGTLFAAQREQMAHNRALFDESHGVLYAIFHAVPTDVLGWALLSLWLALAFLLILRRLVRRVGTSGVGRVANWVTAGLVLISGSLLIGNELTRDTVRRGVVIHADAPLSGARGGGAPRLALPEGLEVRILDEPEDGLFRVRLSSGREGFVATDAVKEI